AGRRAPPLFLEEPVERCARVVRCRRAAAAGQVESLRRSVEGAGVALLLVRDPGGDGLRALEARGAVEVGALEAGVQIGPALAAGRVEADLLGVAALLVAVAAGEDDGLVLVDAAPARRAVVAVGPGAAPAGLLPVARVHVPAVAVLAVVVGHGPRIVWR